MSRFILYRPSPDDVAEAFRRSQAMGVLPNSLTRGSGRMAGFLGEVAFENTYGGKYVGDKSFTHDYEIKGKTVDVKAKICSTKPLPHYMTSVFSSPDKDLPADIYFFARVMKDWSKVWLVGWAPASRIMKPEYYKKKGESDDCGFTFLGNGYHLPINRTLRPDSFLVDNQRDRRAAKKKG